MDSNQEESLDIARLQEQLYTDEPSPSPHFDIKPHDDPSSRPSSPAGLGDESFQRAIDASSETSAESPRHNRLHSEPLIPTDPIDQPMDLIRTSPTVIMSRTARETNTTLTNTGVDKTGTLTLGYSASKQDEFEFDPTQRDSDSYNERLRQRVEVESADPVINFDQEEIENADTQPPIDDDDDDDDNHGDGMLSQQPRPVFFDESKRFETPAAKRRKVGSGDDDEELPLAGLPGNDDMPLGLTQLFDASSPVRAFRPPSSRNNTSPAVMFTDNMGRPQYQPNNDSSPAAPLLGLRKVVTAPVANYVSLQESQERRNDRNKVLPDPDKSDGLDDHADPIKTHWEQKRKERHRAKTVEEQLKNIKAPARPDAVRYGRRPKDKALSSPSTTNSPSKPKSVVNNNFNRKGKMPTQGPITISDDEEEEQSTEDIREIEDPTQADAEVVDLLDGSDDEIQVPSTAKKTSRRSPNNLHSEDTPIRAAGSNTEAIEATDEYVSNSQEDTQSAISDSQPSLRTSQRRGRSTPKTIDEFSTSAKADIIAMIGPLTSSHPRNGDNGVAPQPETLVPESSSPPGNVGRDRDAPPSSPPPPLSSRTTRRTIFESRLAGRSETEPITATPKAARKAKTVSVPPSGSRRSLRGSKAQDKPQTPYPEKSIPPVQPTTIPETSPAFRIDESPAPLRTYAQKAVGPRKRHQEPIVEIPCSLTESLRPTTKTRTQEDDGDAPTEAPSPKTVQQQQQQPQQGQKRALTNFSISIPRKRLRNDTNRVIQDSYDASKHRQQLFTSSENGFSSPPPSDGNYQQLEGATPASPPASSPAPSAELPVSKGFAASGASIVEESSLDEEVEKDVSSTPQGEHSNSKLRGPGKRVFAQFKGGNNYFYPATVVVDAIIAVATEIGVRFDDGTTCSLSKLKVRWLDLRQDDNVKVDRTGLKQKTWLVKGLKKSGEKTELTDIRGNDIVILRPKQTGKKAAAKDSEEIEVKLTEIYLTSTQWPHFDSRHVPFENAGPSTSPERSPTTTPTASKGQLRTPPAAANYSADLASISATAGPLTSGGLFSGMIFAVSYGDKEAEKQAVTSSIERNGGKVVLGDFTDLFTQPTKSGMYEIDLIDSVERWGFACVIADKHSRTPKYLQALALGLPCIAGRWVDVCVKRKKIITWEDYLLPAGESQHLDNAIKSRILPYVPAKEARFVEMFSNRKKLLEGYNVIYIVGTGKVVGGKKKTVVFLVHALGASSVERVPSIESACDRLKKVKSTPVKEKYMIVTTSGITIRPTKEQHQTIKTKKVRLLDDEWVIQSLIMGRRLEPELD